MKYAILVQEQPNGELFLYSSFKAAANDPLNPIEVKERRLHQLKREEMEKQKDLNTVATGFPLNVDGCTIDRRMVKQFKDVAFPKTISDGHGSEWDADCPSCGAKMQVMRPGDARCSEECWLSE